MLGARKTRRNTDGTVTILDVPVFAETVDARGGKVEIYGRNRLEKWLRTAQERATVEGYEAPAVHVAHNHDTGGNPHGQTVQPAGRWNLTRLGRMRLDGREVDTLFADVTVFPEVFERVKAGRLPYRSVEIKPDLSEIRSLALLDRDAPFHKFELLRVEEPAEGEPTLAFADGVTLMSAQTSSTTKAIMGAALADAPAKPAAFAEAVMQPPAQGNPLAALAALGGGGAPAKPDEPKGADASAPFAMIVAMLQGMATTMQAMSERLGVMGAPKSDEEKPVDEKADPKAAESAAPVEQPAPKAPAMADATSSPAYAALMGEVAALRARVEGGEKRERLLAAENRMKSAGATPAHVATFADLASKQGDVVAVAFADALVTGLPKAPADPKPWTGEIEREPLREDPPEVRAFADKGPDMLKKARTIALNHSRAVAQGYAMNSLADTLKANLDTK